MWSTNRNSFLRLLKNKVFQEEIVTKIGLYDLVKSTPLESNKSLLTNRPLLTALVGSHASKGEKVDHPEVPGDSTAPGRQRRSPPRIGL